MSPGKPVRALVLVLTLWIGTRTVIHTLTFEPSTETKNASPSANATPVAAQMVRVSIAAPPAREKQRVTRMSLQIRHNDPAVVTQHFQRRMKKEPQAFRRLPTLEPATLSIQGIAFQSANTSEQSFQEFKTRTKLIPPTGREPHRLSFSAWSLFRSSEMRSFASPQLGGSQFGLRANFLISRQISLTSRLSTALSERGKEATIGISWRPKSASVQILAERRFAIDSSGRNAFSLTVAGGFYDHALSPSLSAEGYVQAGFIGLDRKDGFADAAVRVHRAQGGTSTRLKPGVGAWAATQPGARRIDVGPTMRWQHGRLRTDLDWRFRVSGNARPSSGPVLVIGTDF